MTDINATELKEYRNNGKLVLDGKLVEISRDDFIIVSDGGSESEDNRDLLQG